MSDVIDRDPAAAAAATFDLIVVGGGIYGIMAALEATRRRLRPLLLERHDFAGATSHNSLRILHGGLRYLQSLDLHRALESIHERSWWLTNFPELVEPLPCLMPLYNEGLRRPDAMRLALALNNGLRRLRVGAADRRLPADRVLPADAVLEAYPEAAKDGLAGGALWHDLWAPAAPRLCIEALRWACERGATALNHVEALRPIVAAGRVTGVAAVDRVEECELTFRAPVVIAAAGPWISRFADSLGSGRAVPEASLLAWNLLLHRKPPSACALALKARRPGAQTFFLVPNGERLLAGTAYRQAGVHVVPDAVARQHFLDDLNEAAPPLGLSEDDVVRIYAGRLPHAAGDVSQPAERPTILDYSRLGGPVGLFALAGVKLTIARAVADRTLRLALPRARPTPLAAFRRSRRSFTADLDGARYWLQDQGLHLLRKIVAEEAAVHLDDLLLRRSTLGDVPEEALRLAPKICRALGWSEMRRRTEMARLWHALRLPYRRPPAWLRKAAQDRTGAFA